MLVLVRLRSAGESGGVAVRAACWRGDRRAGRGRRYSQLLAWFLVLSGSIRRRDLLLPLLVI
jgi:hypothetical protein